MDLCSRFKKNGVIIKGTGKLQEHKKNLTCIIWFKQSVLNAFLMFIQPTINLKACDPALVISGITTQTDTFRHATLAELTSISMSSKSQQGEDIFFLSHGLSSSIILKEIYNTVIPQVTSAIPGSEWILIKQQYWPTIQWALIKAKVSY